MTTVTLRVDGTVRRGRVIDLPAGVSPAAVLAAVRGDGDGVAVDCEQPGPVHEHVGYIHSEMGIRTRTALARAGRSRGLTTEYDDEIAAIEAELAALDDSEDGAPTAEFRRALAENGATTAELREAVAAARGRLRACREHGLDTDTAREKLEAAIRELSEHETATAARREQLDRARSQHQRHRDIAEKRLRLEDRRANLRRDARAALVDELRGEYETAIEAVPRGPTPEEPFDAPAAVSALAVARVADLAAPVVLDCGLFDSPGAAGDWLGAPVVYV